MRTDIININQTDYIIPDFNPFWIYGQPCLQQQQQQHNKSKVYFIEDYVAMLTQDAETLFEELVIKVGDEVINDYATSMSTQPSLPALPSLAEEAFHDK